MVTFVQAAGLKSLSPYWLLWLSSITKPIFTLLVFGPPSNLSKNRPPTHHWTESGDFVQDDVECLVRLGIGTGVWIGDWKQKAKNLAGVMAKLAALAMALSSAISDVSETIAITSIDSEDMDMWSKFNCIVIVWSTSSNIASALSAAALWMLYMQTLEFVQYHREVMNEREYVDVITGDTWRIKTQQHMGFLSSIYVWSLCATYLPLTILLCLYMIPACIAYFYIALVAMLVWVLTTQFLAEQVPKLLSHLRGPVDGAYAVNLDDEQKEQVIKKLRDGDQKWGTPDDAKFDYDAEKELFDATGIPKESWGQYFTWPSFSVLVALLVPMAARLYCGHGYVEAMTQTLQERQISHLVAAAQGKVDKMLDLIWTVL